MCNHKRECHCELGWAPPYCQHKVLELTAGRVSCAGTGDQGPTGHPQNRRAHPSADWLSAGASSMVLAAVLAVLVLSSILIGGGFVLLRGKGKKYFQKG